jgi:hypothetical protein
MPKPREPDQRQEQEYVLDTYLSALGMLDHAPGAEADAMAAAAAE